MSVNKKIEEAQEHIRQAEKRYVSLVERLNFLLYFTIFLMFHSL